MSADRYAHLRSRSLAFVPGICPFCLGSVDLGLVCRCCGKDTQTWAGEVDEPSAFGRLRMAEDDAARGGRS